jgi:predicted sugar kinase
MLVRRMAEWGAVGVGQSSWGPAVYGLVDSAAGGRELAARAADLLGPDGRVFQGGFAGSGAKVRWAEAGESPD